jgi:hypothetical protein
LRLQLSSTSFAFFANQLSDWLSTLLPVLRTHLQSQWIISPGRALVRDVSCSSFSRDLPLLLYITVRLRSVAMYCHVSYRSHLTNQQKNCKTGEYSLFGRTYLDEFNSIFERADQSTDTNGNEKDTSAQNATGTTSSLGTNVTATHRSLPKLNAIMALRVKEVFARIIGTGEGAMQLGDVSAVSAFDLSKSLATRMNNQLLFGNELGMYSQRFPFNRFLQ